MQKIEFEVIEWTEGLPYDPIVFKTWSEVNSAIWLYSKFAPTNGSYLKCDYKITWEDGETWTARFDLQRTSPNMTEEMKQRLRFYAGRYTETEFKACGFPSLEEYFKWINNFWGDYKAADLAIFMDTHALQD